VRDYILVLDPGKTTGWATFDVAHQDFASGQEDYDGTCRLLFDTAKQGTDLDIVSESLVITVKTAKNTQATWSLELIGVARAVSRLWTQQELVLQTPAAAKRLCSDDLLKTLGWYKPGKAHANDAARHLGLFMIQRGWMDKRIKQYIAAR
jgi:hypothetical protein